MYASEEYNATSAVTSYLEPISSDIVSVKSDVEFIKNIEGENVEQLVVPHESNQALIDVSTYKTGVYFILITKGASHVSGKLIVQ